jgi:outer membrane protein assembly factor BamD (BamD/ComL family)
MTLARTVRRLLVFAALASLGLLASCKSTGPVDLTGLTPAEVFQRAQDASDSGDYRRALAYYEGFLAQPGVDAERGAWARYETAMLYHKMGDDDTALAKFDELLALYETDKTLPEGPKILATNVKSVILEKRSKKS